MKQLILILSAWLAIFPISLNAQTDFYPGFYITNQGDTIYGEIDNRGDIRNCRVCTFRLNENSEKISFEPGEIMAYRFSEDGKYYISKEVNILEENRMVFLEFLLDGISNLYYYRGEGLDRYYLESKDGRMTELTNDLVVFNVDGSDYARKSNLYVGQMKATFGDCPEIQPKLDKARFSHNSLIQLTGEYHDYVCDGEKCIIYEKRQPVIQVSGGPYAGIISSRIDFPSYGGTDTDFNFDASYKWYHYYTFPKQTDMIMGLRFNFTLPRASEKLGLIFLLEYSQSDYSANTEEQTNPGLLTQMEANAHLSALNTMTGIQYTYPKGRIRPSFAIGPLLSMDLHSTFDIEHTLVTDSEEIIQNFHTEPIKGIVMGGFSQIGADWDIYGPHHMGCNLRYHLNIQRSLQNINRDGFSLSLYYNYLFN
jgi:hypothetical protein